MNEQKEDENSEKIIEKDQEKYEEQCKQDIEAKTIPWLYWQNDTNSDEITLQTPDEIKESQEEFENYLDELSYEKIGREAGLEDARLTLYIKYMNERWADTELEKCYDGYAREWAERFKSKQEYSYSDTEGKRILDRLMMGNINN